jgi:hypothetical protein
MVGVAVGDRPASGLTFENTLHPARDKQNITMPNKQKDFFRLIIYYSFSIQHLFPNPYYYISKFFSILK